MSHPVSVDRAAGALLTMAIGNSLGFLIAGEPPSYAADFARHSLASFDPPWLEKDEFSFGQYVVDMQLARELAQTMIDSKGFSPVLFAARIGELFRSGRALEADRTRRCNACSNRRDGRP